MATLPKTYVPGFHDDEAVAQMTYKQLGQTDMIVSTLSFGAAGLGGIYGDITDTPAAIVKEALQQGINFIDTSPWYGEGKSEEALGTILPNVPRESFYIATKVGRYKLDWNLMFNFSADHVTKGFERSLQLLGLDYVDLLQIHDCEFAPSIDQILNETLPALDKLRQAGKARYIGITGYPLQLLKEIVEKSTVKIDVILSYCRCTLNDTTLLDYLPAFRLHGLGVINASPLSMGLFRSEGPPHWHTAGHEMREATLKAIDLCKKNEMDISRLAIRNALSCCDQVDSLLSTFTSLDLLRVNLTIYRTPLTNEEQAVLNEIIQKYMKPLKQKHWEGIEVAKYHRKLKEIKASGKTEHLTL